MVAHLKSSPLGDRHRNSVPNALVDVRAAPGDRDDRAFIEPELQSGAPLGRLKNRRHAREMSRFPGASPHIVRAGARDPALRREHRSQPP